MNITRIRAATGAMFRRARQSGERKECGWSYRPDPTNSRVYGSTRVWRSRTWRVVARRFNHLDRKPHHCGRSRAGGLKTNFVGRKTADSSHIDGGKMEPEYGGQELPSVTITRLETSTWLRTPVCHHGNFGTRSFPLGVRRREWQNVDQGGCRIAAPAVVVSPDQPDSLCLSEAGMHVSSDLGGTAQLKTKMLIRVRRLAITNAREVAHRTPRRSLGGKGARPLLRAQPGRYGSGRTFLEQSRRRK